MTSDWAGRTPADYWSPLAEHMNLGRSLAAPDDLWGQICGHIIPGWKMKRYKLMNKEEYEMLQIEVIVFESEDVITDSPPVDLPPVERQ